MSIIFTRNAWWYVLLRAILGHHNDFDMYLHERIRGRCESKPYNLEARVRTVDRRYSV